MEKLRTGGRPAARLRLGKESLRRLGNLELAGVRGGEAIEILPDLVDDRRTMDLCPAALPLSRRGGD
jgi:hypothetical protein